MAGGWADHKTRFSLASGPNVTPMEAAPLRVTLRPHASPTVARLPAYVVRVTFGPVALPIDGLRRTATTSPKDSGRRPQAGIAGGPACPGGQAG